MSHTLPPLHVSIKTTPYITCSQIDQSGDPASDQTINLSIDQSELIEPKDVDLLRPRHRRYSSDSDSLALAKVLSNHSTTSNQSLNSNLSVTSNQTNNSGQFYYRATPTNSPSDFNRTANHSNYQSSVSSPINQAADQSRNQSIDFVTFVRPLLVLDPDERQEACDQFNHTILQSIKLSLNQSNNQPADQCLVRQFYSHIIRLSLEAPFRNIRDSMKELLQSINELIEQADEQSNNQSDPSFTQSFSDLHQMMPAHLSASELIPPLLLPTIDEHALDADLMSPSSDQSGNLSSPTDDLDDESIDQSDDQANASSFLLDQFLHLGRITHIERILAYHPSFLLSFNQLIEQLLMDHSTIPQCDRIYIALIAASRMKSHYWYTWLKHLFLLFGGDMDWLINIANAPKHLSNISSMSTLLAFHPWLINEDMLIQLTCSRTQLMGSISITCAIQALAAATEAMQIVPEIDLVTLTNQSTSPPCRSRRSSKQFTDFNDDTCQPTAGLRKTSRGDLITEAAYLHRVLTSELVHDFDVSIATSNQSNKWDMDDMYLSRTNSHASSNSSGQPINQPINQTIDEAFAALYVDCDEVSMRPASYASYNRSLNQAMSPTSSMVPASSFTFHEHASLALDRFAPRLSSTLHRMIDTIMNITTNRIGRLDGDDDQQIDTSPFRRAILVYVHRYFGQYHADFNYKHINLLLSSALQKIIVKIIEAQPLNEEEWKFAGFGLDESEKVHLVLIVAMARMEATFTHACRAVVQLG